MSRIQGNRRWTRAMTMIVVLTVLGCGLALAAPGPEVEIKVDVARLAVRTVADGSQQTIEEPVTNVTPGDVLVYRLTASNVGKAAARNMRLQDPIPKGTVLVTESVSSDRAVVTASIDDGVTYATFPIQIETTAVDGSVTQVPAPSSAYTHLRWKLADTIAPGDEKSVSFKVRVE
ncbi:MAG: hypothetical protein OEV00_13190 [Acidobacteriota bacterium]|nr:hypothetical protein [Acidobacteriota bacterium]MDH3786267.1 hypothetical protein [Acidobacteriota bacterium]